jgi:hypothetical protein
MDVLLMARADISGMARRQIRADLTRILKRGESSRSPA